MKKQAVWEVTLLPDPDTIHCLWDYEKGQKDLRHFASTEDVMWLQKEGDAQDNNIYFPV